MTPIETRLAELLAGGSDTIDLAIARMRARPDQVSSVDLELAGHISDLLSRHQARHGDDTALQVAARVVIALDAFDVVEATRASAPQVERTPREVVTPEADVVATVHAAAAAILATQVPARLEPRDPVDEHRQELRTALRELLGHIADEMSDEHAVEVRIASYDGGHRNEVVGDHGHGSGSDAWTTALGLARLLVQGPPAHTPSATVEGLAVDVVLDFARDPDETAAALTQMLAASGATWSIADVNAAAELLHTGRIDLAVTHDPATARSPW